MPLHVLVLEAPHLLVGVDAALDRRDRPREFVVRRAREVLVAHPVLPLPRREEVRVEVEARAPAELDGLQFARPPLERRVDRRRVRVREDDAVVDELEHRHEPVHEPLVRRRVERPCERHVEDVVELPRVLVVGALARDAAERVAPKLQDVPHPRRALPLVERMARIVAPLRPHAAVDVEVVEAPEAERAHHRHLLEGEALVGALRADRVHAPAAPRRPAPAQRAVRVLLADVLRVPAVGDQVGVAVVAVRDDLVAEPLRVRDRLPQLRLAAEARLHGEDLRPAAVVPAHVPADEAELRAADTLALERIDDFLEALERDDGLHRRLVLHGLVGDGARHRLPRMPHAHLRPPRRVVEDRLRLRALPERLHRPALQLVGAVGARHARVVRLRPRERDEGHRQVLVYVLHVEVVRHRELVDALLQLRREGVVVGHARHDRDERPLGQHRAEERHVRAPAPPRAVPLPRLEGAQFAVRIDPVAGRPLRHPRAHNLHAPQVLRQRRARDPQRFAPVRRLQRDAPHLARPVRPLERDLQVRTRRRGHHAERNGTHPVLEAVLHGRRVYQIHAAKGGG